MTNGIALGNHKTISEVRDRIENQKKRLRGVIRSNKLNVAMSKFKFYWKKATDRSVKYPYFSYVDTPSKKYDWIFIT